MKINIGPYKNWIGPYQIAEKILFWKDKYDDKTVHEFGKWLSENKDGKDSLLTKFCTWIDSKRKRKMKIHIDGYDVWNMNNTLGHIILPMLKLLKEKKHGAPWTDDEDVPEGQNLRSTEAPKKENDYDTDENHFKRWDWIIDEMIWTFEQYTIDWEDQYYSGVHDIVWKKKGDSDFYEMKKGPKDTFKVDNEGMQKHRERMQNGLRLFGKYYDGLWD
jgi:hypothetical protein